ncbi:MAG: DNA replication/repair protein RecF [Chlamydiales bacterium]
MKLKSLYLRTFRNYQEALIHFSPGLNVIYGENGQGKTNLLEAIYLLIHGRSFRTHHMRELIQFKKSSFYLEALFEKNGVEQILKLNFNHQGRSLIHNAASLPSLSSLLGILNGVVISPQDYELVRGGPAIRRQFLDMQIASQNPLYFHYLSRYTRAMKQRNFLLRSKKRETMEIWEAQMAESAAYLISQRLKTIKELEEEQSLKREIPPISLAYQTNPPYHEEIDQLRNYFIQQYPHYRLREIEQGSTLIGPHRDDLLIQISGQEARFFSSDGEARSCATSLRLAEWARLKTITGETPILCIDELGISLDSNRENSLYQKLKQLGQVFVTSPKKIDTLPLDAHCIRVKNGIFIN